MTWINLYFNLPFSSAGYYKTQVFGFEASDFITLSLEPIPLGSVENETLNDLTWQLAFLTLLTCVKNKALPCQAHVDQQGLEAGGEQRSLSLRGDVPLESPSLQTPLLTALGHLRNALNVCLLR